MRTLKRSECSILPLVLKNYWYGLILCGEKKEEYRDFKMYWNKRIENWQNNRVYSTILDKKEKTDIIAFSEGYKKPSLFFICDKILIRKGTPQHPDWGEPETEHYVLGLGERVKIED